MIHIPDLKKMSTLAKHTAESLGIDVEAVDRQLAEHRSLPIHTYYDPDVYDFEIETIFHRSWQYFDLVTRVSNPGDVVVGMVGRIPVVVTRAEDGQLYGFVNICRHRGFRVVEQEKHNCRFLICGYHAWTYNLRGELVRARDTDKEPGFKKSEFSLLPVSVDTWGPAIFVNPDPEASPLRECFPRLDEWTERIQFILEPSHYTLQQEIIKPQQSNWKLWYDNTTECYHCSVIHDKTFGEAFKVKEGEYDVFLDGNMTNYVFKPNPGKTDSKAGHLRSQDYRSFQFFPGSLAIQHDDLMLLCKLNPTSPNSCVFTTHYLAEKGSDPNRVDEWIAIWDQTFNEDAEVATVQQTNIHSNRTPLFRYVSNRESPAQYINVLIWEAYKRAFGETPSPCEIAE